MTLPRRAVQLVREADVVDEGVVSLSSVDLSRITAELHSEDLYGDPASVTLIRLATLCGRLPLQDALLGMSAFERVLLLEACGAPEHRLERERALGAFGAHVFHDRFGRVRLHRTAEEGAGCCADATSLGFIALDPAAIERAEEAEEEAQLLERAHLRGVDRVFARWAAAGELAGRVRDATAWVDRVESVLMFDGHGVHSRSDLSSNTLLRGGLLSELATKDQAAWEPAERVLLVALHALFTTGRAVRFEEFNGRRVTATALATWLLERALCYGAVLGEEIPAAAQADLEALAEYARDAARRVDQTDCVRYRRINGVTLAKRERLALRGRADGETRAAWDAGTDHVRATEERAFAALESCRNRGDAVPLERLFEELVFEAATTGAADYAMSSSFRDLAKAVEQPQTGAGILSLGKRDFFCCVMPSKEFAERCGHIVLQRVLYSVAQRMEFNRWHFVAGNLDPAAIPEQRHFYYPPLMPDLAEWSDVWHPGHTAAGVRYTLRAPGPALWREPLRVAGLAFRGCLDMRLVRTEGPPFTIADLASVSAYSSLIDVVWRAVARDIEANGRLPAIAAYDRTWYEERCWRAVVYGEVMQSA